MILNLIMELTNSWEDYRRLGTTNRQHRVHNLVLNDFPNYLKSWVPNPDKYIFKGSDGQGNILRTPWIATFNPDVTTKATTGFYPVFLFRDDMKEFVLEIGFGATQFREKYGTGKIFFEEIQRAVNGMQTSSKHLLQGLDPRIKNRISQNSTILDSDNDFNLRAYEQCSIYSVTYSIDKMPSEESLKFDYLEMLKLYDSMADSVLLPSEESYVLEGITTPEITDKIELKDFSPYIKKKRNKRGKPSGSPNKRYSRNSEKIGRIGEEFVFNLERLKLVQAGKSDLADKVIWHRNYVSNRTPGWDITSFNFDGTYKLIEVKASIGKSINSIFLTSNEWNQAKERTGTDEYQIYLVANVLKTPEITVLKDPGKWVLNNSIELSVETYTLDFGTEEEEF